MIVDEIEAASLAAEILGMDEPFEDEKMERVEERLTDELHIDLLQFAVIVGKLLPLCAEGISPITDKRYRGFAKDGRFILKTEVQ